MRNTRMRKRSNQVDTAYSIAYSRRASTVPTPVCQLHIKSVRARFSDRGLIQLTRCIMLCLLYVSCMPLLLALTTVCSWVIILACVFECLGWLSSIYRDQSIQADKQVSFLFWTDYCIFWLIKVAFLFATYHIIHTRGPWPPTTPEATAAVSAAGADGGIVCVARTCFSFHFTCCVSADTEALYARPLTLHAAAGHIHSKRECRRRTRV